MRDVQVTDLRNHLPAFLAAVQRGEALRILSRGKVVAHLVPPVDVAEAAQGRLAAARARARVGDVLSPLGDAWDAER